MTEKGYHHIRYR